MSRVTSFLNRVLALALLLASGARVAVARMFPQSQSSRAPSSAKVFALSEAAWQQLRAGIAVSTQQNDDSSSAQPKQEPSKKQDESKQPPKESGTDKDSPKRAECQKPVPDSGDDKKAPPADEKTKNEPRPECESPGGGDGDMGGTGG